MAEEKARGLTIDLGFAHTDVDGARRRRSSTCPATSASSRTCSPASAAVDACLFVVAATEGWKPQSEEHLRILELLGVGHGVVALDQGRPGRRASRAAASTWPTRWPARSWPAPRWSRSTRRPASASTSCAPPSAGCSRATPAAADRGRPRLWVDRSFAARGAGTVVTGTLLGRRGGRRRRARGPARRARRCGCGASRPTTSRVEACRPGSRARSNLVGVDHDEVGRGHAVVRRGQWHETATVDADLQVLDGLGHRRDAGGAPTSPTSARASTPSALRVLGADAIGPGGTGLVRLHLPTALPLVPGDRYVLRESGRGETVGGGEVLDVDPVLPATRARPDRSVDRVVAERGWVDADELERLTGERRGATVGDWVVAPDVLARRTGRRWPSASRRPVTWDSTSPASTNASGPCSTPRRRRRRSEPGPPARRRPIPWPTIRS